MANSVVTNPIVFDTFNTDVTLSSTPIHVRAITFKSAAAGDVFVLEDRSGNKVVVLGQNINGGTVTLEFPEGFWFSQGLYFDQDDTNSGLGSGDWVLIYQ